MSGGGPPHHPHNRHVPPGNSAWNHLPVPSYFPRQPQVAHMQADHSLLHQATWHTPTTTEAMKLMPHSQMLNEMFKNEALFPRDCVDLSLTRNGNQNGELPPTPTAISLSVRDASKINSLPSSMLDIQAVGLTTKCVSSNLKAAISPGSIRATAMTPNIKSASPGLLGTGPASKSLSPGRKSLSPSPKVSSASLNLAPGVVLSAVPATISASELGKNQKRSIRVDSILERLNPTPEKTFPYQDAKHDQSSMSTIISTTERSQPDKPPSQIQSVIVSTTSNYDENSNSSGTTNVPTPKEEDSASVNSNEDSLDSTKSRRKRKPSKTIRVNKEDEIKSEKDQFPMDVTSIDLPLSNHKEEPTDLTPHTSDPATIATILEGTAVKLPEPTDSATDELDDVVLPAKTRRKTSSESETIDNIAAMVQEGLKEKGRKTIVEVETKVEENFIKASSEEPKKNTEMPVPPTIEDAEYKLEPESSSEKPEVMSELDVVSVLTDTDKSSEDNIKEEEVQPAIPVDTVEGLDIKENDSTVQMTSPLVLSLTKPVTVSVIKTKEILEETLSSQNDVSPEAPAAAETTPAPVLPPVPPLITPAQKKASITHFVEVENKLEEMFAGIVEEDASTPALVLEPLKNDSTLGLIDDSFIKLNDASLPKVEAVPDPESKCESPPSPNDEADKDEGTDAKPLMKKARRSRPPSKSEGDLDGEVPSKKKKLTKTKGGIASPKKLSRSPAGVVVKSPKKTPIPVTSNKTPVKTVIADVARDTCFYDSGSNASSSKSKGPFVHIRGPRDSPLSVSVVNTPLAADEDGERKLIKTKKFHDDSEYRHKVRSKGLHCSTLSNKYDAERKDASWICAFCKRGPHANELSGPSVVNEVPPPGDLFGPYFITTQCPEFEKRLDDPYDRQFKSRKISKALDAAAAAATLSKSGKKTKRKSESLVDPTDLYLGITDTGNGTYEVWMHEDCMVWSSGVYLVGPKIAGLEEAVWTCSNLPCSGCGLKGANITCVKRGCLSMSHVCCARRARWHLDEANFKAYCPEHRR